MYNPAIIIFWHFNWTQTSGFEFKRVRVKRMRVGIRAGMRPASCSSLFPQESRAGLLGTSFLPLHSQASSYCLSTRLLSSPGASRPHPHHIHNHTCTRGLVQWGSAILALLTCWGTASHTVEYLAVHLASTHYMPITPT